MVYCTFCGFANCVKCTKKTRLYPQQPAGQKERGKVCKLCDRKFLIKDMVLFSSKQIKMHNDVISNTLQQRTAIEN